MPCISGNIICNIYLIETYNCTKYLTSKDKMNFIFISATNNGLISLLLLKWEKFSYFIQHPFNIIHKRNLFIILKYYQLLYLQERKNLGFRVKNKKHAEYILIVKTFVILDKNVDRNN